jgi:hypothetical protein
MELLKKTSGNKYQRKQNYRMHDIAEEDALEPDIREGKPTD